MKCLEHKTQKAKKIHRCNYCLENIIPGDVYNNSAYVYDGGFYRWKSHLNCAEIANELNMFDRVDEGLDTDDFWEFVQEAYSNIMSTHYNEEYESETFKIPPFKEQLNLVCEHHLKMEKL